VRSPRPDLAPHPALPTETRLWAAMIQASGGIWGGCVYDTDSIVSLLRLGQESLVQQILNSETQERTK
jgi:hypothetical protein